MLPKTVKNEFILTTGETKEEINNVIIKYMDSIVELDSNSKLIAPNVSMSPNTQFDYITLNTGIAETPTTVGTIYWDEQDGVPTAVLRNARLQIGKEEYIDGLNKTATTISNGAVVFTSGAQGNRMTVDLADANNYADSGKTIGMATHDIAKNVNGNITTFGLVRELNTSAYDEGDVLFLSETAGACTTVQPSFGIGRWHVGMVVKSHVSDGEIFINVHEDKYMFGDVDGGNYSGFEDSGTLVAIGNAKTWVDIDFPIIIRTTGTGIPTLETIQGNITAPQWQVNDVNICEGQEFIHQWKEASEVRWHLHMLTNGQDATARYVNWEVEYFWVKPNNVISATTTATYEFEIPANTPSKTMFIVPIQTWTPTAGVIGGHIFARLRRIASVGTAPTNNPWCNMLQLHVQCDTLGSREVQTK